jgi:hypothetical protein
VMVVDRFYSRHELNYKLILQTCEQFSRGVALWIGH